MKKPVTKTVANQPSWVLRNDQVEMAVTVKGGHMAPVTFYRKSDLPVQPYFISPWQYEKGPKVEPKILSMLRGDFFCLPFGGGKHGGVEYPAHGQPAGEAWKLRSLDSAAGKTQLTLTMDCTIPKGRVTKTLALVDGQNVVYSQHLCEGFSGRFPLGHHATLAMPDEQRAVEVSTSPTVLGLTYPSAPGNPGEGEYFALRVGQKFKDLRKVPTIWKDYPVDDCSTYPRLKGFCDILGVFSKPVAKAAWTAAVFTNENFMWFSLKDPSVLPCLTIWTENHGRWTFPWNGRTNCLGLEDVAAYLATGMGASLSDNAANQAGIPTAIELSPKTPTAVNYIQGVVKVPTGFTRVAKVQFAPGSVTFVATSGKKVTTPVNHEFLFTGAL